MMLRDWVGPDVVRLLRHRSLEVIDLLMEYILFTDHGPLWQAIYGLYAGFLVTFALANTHAPISYQVLLTMAMSLIGDQVMFLIPEIFDLKSFWLFFLMEFAVAILVVAVCRPSPKPQATVLDLLRSIAEIVIVVVRVRLFHRLSVLPDTNSGIVVCLSLLFVLWPEIIGFCGRKVTGYGAEAHFPAPRQVILIASAATVALALSRPSPLSLVLGMYPIDHLAIIMGLALMIFA